MDPEHQGDGARTGIKTRKGQKSDTGAGSRGGIITALVEFIFFGLKIDVTQSRKMNL